MVSRFFMGSPDEASKGTERKKNGLTGGKATAYQGIRASAARRTNQQELLEAKKGQIENKLRDARKLIQTGATKFSNKHSVEAAKRLDEAAEKAFDFFADSQKNLFRLK